MREPPGGRSVGDVGWIPSLGRAEIDVGQLHPRGLKLELFLHIECEQGCFGFRLPLQLRFGFIRKVVRESAIRSDGAVREVAHPIAASAAARGAGEVVLVRA